MIQADETFQRIEFLLSFFERFDLYLLLFDLRLLFFECVDEESAQVVMLHVFDFALGATGDKKRFDCGDIFRAQAEVASSAFFPGERHRLQTIDSVQTA